LLIKIGSFQTRPLIIILLPIALSSFTHLWNPVGFPDVFYDEGVYLRRAMHVLDGLGPQESDNYYDHPFFGQLFLAGVFKLVNYPDFIVGNNPAGDAQSIDTLYSVPRIIMGILALADTYLVFKIAEKRYGMKVALVASILFAVMPMTWITRRVVLDSILLPFLLMSILFALNSATSNRKHLWIVLSGVCLGIAIFTKVPAFTMIPLVSYLLISQSKSAGRANYRLLALWLIPVILIPSLWPVESILSGNFDSWLSTALWQAQRGDRTEGLPWITGAFILFDPILFGLSIAGVVFAAMKKNWLVLFWTVPYLAFLALIGQTNYFHWTVLLPVFCISSALVLLDGIPRLFSSVKTARMLTSLAVVSIAVVGLAFTTTIISADVSLSQRQMASFVLSYLDDRDDTKQFTIISSPTYSWALKYVYRENALDDYRDVLFFPVKTPEWILVADYHFKTEMKVEPKLQAFYDAGKDIASFNSYPNEEETASYPYTNMIMTREGQDIQLRASR